MYQSAIQEKPPPSPTRLRGEPITYTTPRHEPGRYAVTCVPAMGGDGSIFNWSFKRLQEESFLRTLSDLLPSDTRTYYAPTVSFMSGAILSKVEFTVKYRLGRGRRLLRPGYDAFNERLRCDAVTVSQDEAFAMSAAGCLQVALTSRADPSVCLAGHGGRDSLMDPREIITGKPSRPFFGLIDALVDYAHKYFQARPEDLILRSFFALPWQCYPHDSNDADPRIAEINGLRYERLHALGLGGAFRVNDKGEQCLSLSDFVRLRAEQLGIGKIETGLHDLGDNPDCAHTRHTIPGLRGEVRNLVFLRRLP